MSDAGRTVAIIGATGAIGRQLVLAYAERADVGTVFALSRHPTEPGHRKVRLVRIDLESEASIVAAATACDGDRALDVVIVATGMLHAPDLAPERALRDLDADKLRRLFDVNTIGPALVAKHFLPRLPRGRRALFGVLSARVGSISDNRLGGWYAYRASKAALNMIVKCAAIETARRAPQAVVVGLHPGTVEGPLSRPFTATLDPARLFPPEKAASLLVATLEQLTPAQSGRCFAYDGSEILP